MWGSGTASQREQRTVSVLQLCMLVMVRAQEETLSSQAVVSAQGISPDRHIDTPTPRIATSKAGRQLEALEKLYTCSSR